MFRKHLAHRPTRVGSKVEPVLRREDFTPATEPVWLVPERSVRRGFRPSGGNYLRQRYLGRQSNKTGIFSCEFPCSSSHSVLGGHREIWWGHLIRGARCHN